VSFRQQHWGWGVAALMLRSAFTLCVYALHFEMSIKVSMDLSVSACVDDCWEDCCCCVQKGSEVCPCWLQAAEKDREASVWYAYHPVGGAITLLREGQGGGSTAQQDAKAPTIQVMMPGPKTSKSSAHPGTRASTSAPAPLPNDTTSPPRPRTPDNNDSLAGIQPPAGPQPCSKPSIPPVQKSGLDNQSSSGKTGLAAAVTSKCT
jgi:hypothetical protein